MAAQWIPITRPVATTSITDDGADGARLVNFYATATSIPQESVVPLLLRKVPGFSDGYDPNSVSDRTPTTEEDGYQRMIFSVDSPIYGNHLFVLSAEHLVVYESTGDNDLSAADEYYWIETPSNFTVSASKPRRWATDGRFVMIISDTEVWCFDRKGIQKDAVRTNKRDSATLAMQGNKVWIAIVAPSPDDPNEQEQTENWVDVVWSDGYFILGNEAGQIWNSNLHSRQFDQLDFARADINPDPIVGLTVFQSKLFALGTQSIELWQNIGGTRFAFGRDRQYSESVGCYSRETIQTNEDGIYFVGDDLKVYRLSSGGLRSISNDAVHETLRKSAIKPDTSPTINSFLYTEEGHKFYCLNVGEDGYYWCYDDMTGAWHERSTIDGEGDWTREKEKYIVMVANYKNKNWVLTKGYEDAKVRQMGLDYGKGINGNDIEQICVLPVIEGERSKVLHFNIQVIMEISPDESDRSVGVVLGWNDKRQDLRSDGEWKERSVRNGKSLQRIKWNRLGQAPGSGRNYRFKITDSRPKINMLGVYLHAEVLIH